MNRKQEKKVAQVCEALALAPTHATSVNGKTMCGRGLIVWGGLLPKANDGGHINSVVYFTACWRSNSPNLCPECIEALGLKGTEEVR